MGLVIIHSMSPLRILMLSTTGVFYVSDFESFIWFGFKVFSYGCLHRWSHISLFSSSGRRWHSWCWVRQRISRCSKLVSLAIIFIKFKIYFVGSLGMKLKTVFPVVLMCLVMPLLMIMTVLLVSIRTGNIFSLKCFTRNVNLNSHWCSNLW